MKYLSQDQVQTDYAEAAGDVPGARRAPAGVRGVQRRELRGRLPGDPAGPDVLADPAVGAIENAYKGRFGTSSTRRPKGDSTARPTSSSSSTRPPRRPTACSRRAPASRPSSGRAGASPPPRPSVPCTPMSTTLATDPAPTASRARAPASGRLAATLAAPADHRPRRAGRRLHGARAPAADGRRRLPLVQEPQRSSRSASSSTRRGPGWTTTESILFDADNPLHSGFLGAVQNTAVYTFWTVGGRLGGGLAVALLLNREMRGIKVIRTLMLTPWIVPSFVVAVLWQFMWQSDVGIINKVLVDFTGILGERPVWLIGRTRCGRSSSRASGAGCRSRC